MIINNQIKLFTFLMLFCISCFIGINVKGENLDSLLKVESGLINDTNKVKILNQISTIYLEDSFIESLKYSKKSLRLAQQLNYKDGILKSLINLANANDYLGRYSEAQKLNFQILSIYESSNDISGINSTYNNIAIIHYYLGNYDLAIEYTEKALKHYLNEKDLDGISMCYNNLANSYSDLLKYDTALTYYFKALSIYEEVKNDDGISLAKGNIGEVYIELDEVEKAYSYLISALQIAEKTKDKWQQSNILSALGDLLSHQNKPDESLQFLLRALEINEELGAKSETGELYQFISKVMEQKGDYIQAVHYLKLTKEVNDDLYNQENSATIAEMNALYEIKEKEKELLKQEAVVSYQKFQKTAILIGSIIGFLLLFIIVYISVRGNIHKRKINQTLEIQKDQIEMKNRDITDSIQYAKRIQGAILPSDHLIKQHIKDNFILYIPKDIVAGDFYWMETIGDTVLIAVADCTGHGVPGAMVSIVCNNALNRAVREFGLIKPSEILDKVRDLVIETFEKSEDNIKDGMDIALCSLNLKNNELDYAGANNSLYLIRNNELIEIKSDKQPIGKFMNNKPFTNHSQKVLKEDKIYLFTDGYADQFGGERGKKFKYKQFKDLLLKHQSKTMNEQLNVLTNTFKNWKGELDQIDDICVIGVKI
jgi:serine phosphatase RsbU (regulator of sigma subunit)